MTTQIHVIARNVINLNGDEEDFGMTTNIDPNEAWLDEILSKLSKPTVRATDPPYPGQQKKRVAEAKAEILAKLHEAGELERELESLPRTVAIMNGPDDERPWESYWVHVGSGPARRVYGDTPLQAVHALRKKLEEEKLL